MDYPRSEVARPEMNPITKHNSSAQTEPRRSTIPTNSSMACLYPRWASGDVKLFKTSDLLGPNRVIEGPLLA